MDHSDRAENVFVPEVLALIEWNKKRDQKVGNDAQDRGGEDLEEEDEETLPDAAKIDR